MKKNYLKILTLLSLSIIVFASCEKEEKTENINTIEWSSDERYYPLAPENTWTYEGGSNYTVTILDEEKLNGKYYYEVENTLSMSSENSKIRYDDGKYYTTGKAVFSNGQSKYIDLLFLNENADSGSYYHAGTIEIYNYGIDVVNEYYVDVISREASYEIDGITYVDVIVQDYIVEATYTFSQETIDFYGEDLLNESYPAGTITQRQYYAKGVGLVKQTSSAYQGNIDLKEYKLF